MFDGQHRQRPNQSFGKTEKMMSRQETIRQAAEERRQREHKCKQNSSAIIIQSWCRTHFERKKLREEMRLEFDSELRATPCPTLAELLSLSRKLICISRYRKEVADDNRGIDDKRLTELIKKMLDAKREVAREMKAIGRGGTASVYLTISVKKMLELSCRFVSRNVTKHDTSLEQPLLMLKEFTTLSLYLDREGQSSQDAPQDSDGDRALKVIRDIKEHLCNAGYFAMIKLLLDHKVTTSDPRLGTTGTPGEEGPVVLELLERFLVSKDRNCRFLAYWRAAEELFCQQLTNQTSQFLLPALARPEFPYSEMLESLSESQLPGGLTQMQMLNLLYCLLKMGCPHFGNMDSGQMRVFLQVISRLVFDWSSREKLTVRSGVWIADTDERYVDDSRGDDDDEDGTEEEEEEEDEDDFVVLTEEYQESMEWFNEYETPVERAEKRLKRLCHQELGNNRHLSDRLMKLLGHSDNGGLSSDRTAVASLCRMSYNLIGSTKQTAARRYRIVGVLGCSPLFIRNVWELLNSPTSHGPESHVSQISRASPIVGQSPDSLHLLSTFCNAYSYHLETQSDNDLRDESKLRLKPFDSLQVLSKVALTLRDCCLALVLLIDQETRLHMVVSGEGAFGSHYGRGRNGEYARVFKETVALTRQLYERNCRIKFLPSEDWVAPSWSLDLLGPNCRNFLDLNLLGSDAVRSHFSAQETSKLVVLKKLPFTINFSERVEFFRNLLNRDKPRQTFSILSPANTVKIRRDYIYEDAFANLQEANVPDMKAKLHFSFISPLGLEEPGIDGGGIFRETMREVIKAGFNPNLGFFQVTDDGLLHPNHLAERVSPDYLEHFYFLGRMLGKAIYARLLVELPLASFFLVKLLSQETTRLDIHHLSSLDPKIHQGLLAVRDHHGDVRDLDIYFACDYEELGVIKTVDLKPNGRSIQVDNQNKFEYIHLAADWYLNKRIAKHCMAFRKGLGSVVDMDWLRIFDHNELQFLVSGANLPIDLDDLKKNTNYTGGYTADHEVIQNFWSVVEEFSESQRQDLLKFVTCSPRAPLYGFRELRPSFSIHLAGTETDRLPTSSTCMNLLKLPAFKDRATLREKLLKAIEMGAGFELS